MNVKLHVHYCILIMSLNPLSVGAKEPRLAISVKQITWIRCQEPLGIKLSIEGQLRNISQRSVPIGKLAIAGARLYHQRYDGKLETIGTTKAPDELGQGVPLESSSVEQGQSERAEEAMLAPGRMLRFTISHYMYFSSKYVQHRGNHRDLIVSFHVISVLDGRSTREYWTDVVAIHLPSQSQCIEDGEAIGHPS